MARTGYNKYDRIRIDNAGIIFPSVFSEDEPTFSRISLTLRVDVDKSVLQAVLERVIKRFSYYQVYLERDLFWYHFRPAEDIPKIQDDILFPCGFSDFRHDNFLFRFFLKGSTISIETSHILADAYGTLIFLNTLAAEYLKAVGVKVPGSDGIFSLDEPPSDGETEYSYRKNYRKGVPYPDLLPKAYHISGKVENTAAYHTVRFRMPLSSVKKLAKEYQVSLNTLMTVVYMRGLVQVRESEKKTGKGVGSSTIRIELPVNLRNMYSSRTLRNFSLFISPEIDVKESSLSFAELVKIVEERIKKENVKETFDRHITRNVSLERNIFLRSIPLFLKDKIFKMVYHRLGEYQFSGFFTNIGNLTFSMEMEKYIVDCNVVPARSTVTKSNCAMFSYKDRLYLNFGRVTEEANLERAFMNQLTGLSIPFETEIPPGHRDIIDTK